MAESKRYPRPYLEDGWLDANITMQENRPARGTVPGARAHLADVRRCLDEIACLALEPLDGSELIKDRHMVALNRLMDLEIDVGDIAKGEESEVGHG